MPRIMLCVNQEENDVPYIFPATGGEVYTFEEALYHIFSNWKEAAEGFICDEFILWVRDILKLESLSSQISELAELDSPYERLLKFLSLTGFYSHLELSQLKSEMEIWEGRLEWERHLSIGDMFMRKEEPQKALSHYKKALRVCGDSVSAHPGGGKSLKLLNNTGICLMRLGLFKEACLYLRAAYETGGANIPVLLNYAEALILDGEFERAFNYLKKAERPGERAEIDYLYGLLAQKSGNLTEAQNHYGRAIEAKECSFYSYALAKAYTKQRKFNKALETLEQIKVKDREFFVNQAAVYDAFGDNAAAIKCTEKALFFGRKENLSELWTLLSKYRRQNYELDKAERAAAMAWYADKENKHALFEMAKVKKARGNYKDYRKNLEEILKLLKKEYRDSLDLRAGD